MGSEHDSLADRARWACVTYWSKNHVLYRERSFFRYDDDEWDTMMDLAEELSDREFHVITFVEVGMVLLGIALWGVLLSFCGKYLPLPLALSASCFVLGPFIPATMTLSALLVLRKRRPAPALEWPALRALHGRVQRQFFWLGVILAAGALVFAWLKRNEP
jgi:hypothetical protein